MTVNSNIRKLSELSIEDIKTFYHSDWILIKGNYIYIEGNAYPLDTEVIVSEEDND